ncbi:MAG TPA: acetate/propionate family kinase [Baekduia sp.]|uniref:acetate/propionate family kinase n=1 Tax=Baekduia sp. TaxID=2600305 RepID=UPI002DAB0D93|nr:acetate/propionate family kinase [Baekduia sp.]
MRVLVVNAGSSSLKLSLLDGDDEDAVLASASIDPDDDVAAALDAHGLCRDAEAVGHRIVHGGTRFTAAARIDADVEAGLRALTDLAPLHQPKSLAALDAVSAALPALPAVACFDTAFHATLPPAAATYALPRAWRERWELRRYGFHGLSHAWIARTVRAPRVVSCHLGAGASLCAIRDGRSVDTTMGFTPLEGLVMATRSGSVDPGLVLWLQRHEGLDADTIAEALEHESGLQGLAGTADLREILGRDDEDAVLALDAYVHRLRGSIAAMAAALGGLDALVFTGGVGEHAPEIRRRAAEGLAFLGVAIDPTKNAGADTDLEISAPGAAVATHVVAAREDREIARQVRAVLG